VSDRPKQVYSFSGSLIARFILFLVLITLVVGLFGYAAVDSKDDQLKRAAAQISELKTVIEANQSATECIRVASANLNNARDKVDQALDAALALSTEEPRDPVKMRQAAQAYAAEVDKQSEAVKAYDKALKGC
jgi:hypothetical protein